MRNLCLPAALAIGAAPNSTTAVAGGAIGAHWSAAPGHSANDWIGLFYVGDPDTTVLASQHTGNGTTGQVTLTALPAGQYEVWCFLNDSFVRAASGDRVTVFRGRGPDFPPQV